MTLSDKEKLEWYSNLSKSLNTIKLMLTDTAYSKKDVLTQITILEKELKSIDSGFLPAGPGHTVKWPIYHTK